MRLHAPAEQQRLLPSTDPNKAPTRFRMGAIHFLVERLRI